MAVKTKTELEREIKELKGQIRELRSDVKSDVSELKDLTSTAIGVTLNKEGFSLVTIKFDSDKKSAIIIDSSDLGNNLMVAASKLKNSIIDELLNVSKGDK